MVGFGLGGNRVGIEGRGWWGFALAFVEVKVAVGEDFVEEVEALVGPYLPMVLLYVDGRCVYEYEYRWRSVEVAGVFTCFRLVYVIFGWRDALAYQTLNDACLKSVNKPN
jgi:hypothetical protein